MKLRYIFLFILLIFLVFISALFLSGMRRTPPQGLELNVSENLNPNATVFVLDQFRKTITSIETNDDFFPQQKGLAEGTVYGFRVMDENNVLIMPVYESFIAQGPDWTGWEIGGRYYYGLLPGNYSVELLVIENDTGIIIARTNLSSFSLYEQRAGIEKKVADNCSYLLAEPVIDADGWSRETKIGKCAASVGVEIEDTYVCEILFKVFNDSGVGFGECILSYAIISENISICDQAGMPKSRGFCKAKVTNDWTQCRNVSCDSSCPFESLDTQIDLCISWYAVETRNATLCNEIKSNEYNMKEACFNITAEG